LDNGGTLTQLAPVWRAYGIGLQVVTGIATVPAAACDLAAGVGRVLLQAEAD
jgi:hypothetical protein